MSVQLWFYMTGRVLSPVHVSFPTENIKCSDSQSLRFRKWGGELFCSTLHVCFNFASKIAVRSFRLALGLG